MSVWFCLVSLQRAASESQGRGRGLQISTQHGAALESGGTKRRALC